jgi:hypothetical protein
MLSAQDPPETATRRASSSSTTRARWLAHTAGTRAAAERAKVELIARHVDDTEPEQQVTAEERPAAHRAARAPGRAPPRDHRDRRSRLDDRDLYQLWPRSLVDDVTRPVPEVKSANLRLEDAAVALEAISRL